MDANMHSSISVSKTFSCLPSKSNAGAKVLEQMVLLLRGMSLDLEHLGLPRKREPKLNSWKVKEIYMLHAEHLTHRQIGAELGISASYVCRVLAYGYVECALQELCFGNQV